MICLPLRAVEYLLPPTDQSIFDEALVNKLAGSLVLMLAIRQYTLNRTKTGFANHDIAKNILYGLLLGTIVFAAAYAAEFLLQLSTENTPSLQLYL